MKSTRSGWVGGRVQDEMCNIGHVEYACNVMIVCQVHDITYPYSIHNCTYMEECDIIFGTATALAEQW